MTSFASRWLCAGRVLDLTARPLVMGILNVTPDSFSDGGEHHRLEDALAWARRLTDEGADIVDVGGESTRPGFSEDAVTLEEERRRVLPVVRALALEGFIVSVDTSKPEIMTETAELGAAILNDVRGFERPGAIEAAAATQCGLVVMHRAINEPLQNASAEVEAYLRARQRELERLGVQRERICWDPGFGFGKSVEQNFELLAATPSFAASGQPLMTAISRKSSIGAVIGAQSPKDRVAGSVAGAVLAAQLGAQVLRVHDVRETADALAVLGAIRMAQRRLSTRSATM